MMVMQKTPDESEIYSEAETDERREELLKRMLNTPPKPHKPKSGSAKRDQPV